MVAETHDTHHPLGPSLYYEDQKPAARRRAKAFRTERMGEFLDWFEATLARNPTHSGWLAGRRCTYADLSLYQLVEGWTYAFPKAMRKLMPHYPLVAAVHARVPERPRLAAYLASDRRLPFNESGIFRHYPELDG